MPTEDPLNYFYRKSFGKEVEIRMLGEDKPLTIHCKINHYYKVRQEGKGDQMFGLLITPTRIDFEDDFYTEILREGRPVYVKTANIITLTTK